MWLDVSAYRCPASALVTQIRQRSGLVLADGTVYQGNGAHFLRLNLACPPVMLADGLQRLASGLAATD